MRRTAKLVIGLMFSALLTPSLSTPARAGDTFNIRGPSALADFFSTDPSGCVFTDVFVFANDRRLHDPPGPPTTSSEASVGIFQADFCTGTERISAFGSGQLADPAFQITPKLTSATLNTTIEVFDSVSGSTFNVDVALTWTGTGGLIRQSQRLHFRSPGFIQHFRFNGTFRDAEASGSVSLGGTNLTPQPSFFAQLASIKEGSVVID
jgi:hypothetical protein